MYKTDDCKTQEKYRDDRLIRPQKKCRNQMREIDPRKVFQEVRAPLIWRKNIGILEVFNPIGNFPMKPFETKD